MQTLSWRRRADATQTQLPGGKVVDLQMERLSNRAVAYALIIMTVVLVLLDIGNIAKVDSSHFTVLATIVGILLGARHKTGDVRGENTDTGTDVSEKERTKETEGSK